MKNTVYIPSRTTGYAHPKCYLSHTNGCSTKITGEHCISHNLLNRIEKHNKTVDVVGLGWLPRDRLTSIGKKNLVSTVLCSQHNSALSPLDSAIGDLVEAISSIDADFQSQSPLGLSYSVDGLQMERWVLKTLLGLVRSGQIKQQSGELFTLKVKCLELLCKPAARWPLGWGLYVATPAEMVHHSSSFELLPVSNPDTGEILAVGLKFNGIAMNFLMGKPGHPAAFGVRRPRRLIFVAGPIKSQIELLWPSRKQGAAITFSHVGIYRGTSPSHAL